MARRVKGIWSARLGTGACLNAASSLALMPFGNSFVVPEGHSENSPACQRRVARFKSHRVPEGRKRIGFKSWIFCRPSGTCLYSRLNPALKRRAIVGCPSGTHPCLNSRKASSLARRADGLGTRLLTAMAVGIEVPRLSRAPPATVKLATGTVAVQDERPLP